MSDNLDLNPNETNNINTITTSNSVNTHNVNMTSNNSLPINENSIDKSASVSSGISIKSSKSNKSLKSEKSKKKNKVKSMFKNIKKLEKHIIHSGKKKKSEDNIGNIIERSPMKLFEDTQYDENITEKNNDKISEEIVENKINEIITSEPTNTEAEQNVVTEKEENNKDNVKEEIEEITNNKIENVEVVEEKENPIESNEEYIEIVEEIEEISEDEVENDKVVEEKEETVEGEVDNDKIVEVKEETAENEIEKEEVKNDEVDEEKEETVKNEVENEDVVENEVVNEKVEEEKEEAVENEVVNEEVDEEKEAVENIIENEEVDEEEAVENKIENEDNEEKEEAIENIIENEEVDEEETVENKIENEDNEEKEAIENIIENEVDEEKEEAVENIIENEVDEEKEEAVENKIENEVDEEKEEIIENKVENIELNEEKETTKNNDEDVKVDEEKEDNVENKVNDVIEEKEETVEDIVEVVEENESSEDKIEEKDIPVKLEGIVENDEKVIEETKEEIQSNTDNEEVIIIDEEQEINDNVKEKESDVDVSEYKESDLSSQTNVIDLYKEIGGDTSESESKMSVSGESNVEEEFNGFSKTLKSIDIINKTEKQFLIPNSDAIEGMINKSLKRNSRIDSYNSARDSLDVNSISNNRNSYQSYHSNLSHQSQHSGSNLHIQIAPPQPPPATPLPPTPKGLPPNFFNQDNTKGHLQHLSLGRLTEVVENEDQQPQKRGSNSTVQNYMTDNSTPLSSTVQMVTIQNVGESNTDSVKRESNTGQPLQAVVYNFDSEDDESTTNEYSYNDQPLKAEVHSIEDSEELSQSQTSEDVRDLESEISTEVLDDNQPKGEEYRTSSQKLKETLFNIENLLEDLDSHIQSLRTPKMKPVDQEGYDADGEKSLSVALSRSNIRSSLNIDNEIPNISPNFGLKDKSDNSDSYVDSSMSDDSESLPPAIIDGPPLSITTFEDGSMSFPTVTEDGPMSQKSLQEIALQNTLQHSISSIPLDDDFDVNHSINNNLRILKSSSRPSSVRDIPMIKKKKNPMSSPLISSKALKLVGIENHTIPNMSTKALKMLGMNTPKEKDNFENFEFDEKELAMLNAAPSVSPHLMNNNLSKSFNDRYMPKSFNDDYLSKSLNDDYMPKSLDDDYMPKSLNDDYMPKSLNDDYMPKSLNDDYMPKSLNDDYASYSSPDMKNDIIINERPLSFEALEEAENLLIDTDIDDSIKDPKLLKIGSVKSNNSSNNSMSQKALKVFGISERELNKTGIVPTMVNNNISPLASNGSLSPNQQFNTQMDNLNLSRYSINDGEKHFNGVISSKALKIIGLEDSNTPASSSIKKASKLKKEKVKPFEEVKESNRNLMPTPTTLRPLISDYLYFNTHGILRSWKKRYTVLTQDGWIYGFTSNESSTHAFIAVPINSNTEVQEIFDPINIVPYFIDITTNWPVESTTRRFISIGCDNRQKCQFWINSIKRLIARDKFSNAKLPPNPTVGGALDDELAIGNVNINRSPRINPVMMSGFRNGRPLTMSGPSIGGDLGSLYDDITGIKLERNNMYGEQPQIGTPMLSPVNGPSNIIKKSPVKNIRITKHPVRKESIKQRYGMLTSPNIGAINVVSNRTSKINNNPSTIPMVSSSPLLKGQYSPYSQPINKFALSSPSIKPISLPSASQPINIIPTPKSYSGSYSRSPMISPAEAMTSPMLSPRQTPINVINGNYHHGYNPNHYDALNMMEPMEDMMDYETIRQQKMIQQEELIKQQQQQILLLQQQLLKSQQEMEPSFIDMPKDNNY